MSIYRSTSLYLYTRGKVVCNKWDLYPSSPFLKTDNRLYWKNTVCSVLCGQDVLSCSTPSCHCYSQSLSHAVCPQPTLRLLPTVSCTPDPAWHSQQPALSLSDDAITTQNVQTDREYCMQSRRVWELLELARFMRSVQPAGGAAASMLNQQILCCTIVAFLSPKGNVRLQTCYL